MALPTTQAFAKVAEYNLTIATQEVDFTGEPVKALTVNGGIPGPVLEFTEGDVARIHVRDRPGRLRTRGRRSRHRRANHGTRRPPPGLLPQHDERRLSARHVADGVGYDDPGPKPPRIVKMNLTGDMDRYVWSTNGEILRPDDTIRIKKGERVRFEMSNRTMMNHPMHLYGHFYRVLNGQGAYAPLKHTINVSPMETTVIEFDAATRTASTTPSPTGSTPWAPSSSSPGTSLSPASKAPSTTGLADSASASTRPASSELTPLPTEAVEPPDKETMRTRVAAETNRRVRASLSAEFSGSSRDGRRTSGPTTEGTPDESDD